MEQHRSPFKRRAMIGLGLAATTAWVIGAPHLGKLWPAPLNFQTIKGLEPFRRLERPGALTTANIAMIGIPDPDAVDDTAFVETIRADPCAALFRDAPPGPVPVAIFSDFNCPNCVVFDRTVAELHAASPDQFQVVRHQLPLLGPSSDVAARAVLAAELQGGYDAMHARLTGTRLITDRQTIATIANEIGLNSSRLAADMNRPDITDAIAKTKAAAKVFGLYGTPAAVIGHSVTLGVLSAKELRTIIDDEAGFACT